MDNTSLSTVFSPVAFRRDAAQAALLLEAYLSDTSVRGLHLVTPATLTEVAKSLMTAQEDTIASFDEERFRHIIELYIQTGIQVHSPGYMGRQFSGVVPLAGVVDMVSSVLNQPCSFYEAAQLPSVAEHIMAAELNRFIGFDAQRFAMISTSGGSMANLTALLAARNDRFPNIWEQGMAVSPSEGIPAIALSEEAHYSLTRAVGILGIGEKHIIRLPVDPVTRQIDVRQVQSRLDDARKKGLCPFCLVAAAGSTSVGAIDPIGELAEIARKNGLWLHVDGSHGASLLVSDALRSRLQGIDQADSVTWDAHKMMFVPSPCSLLFYKEKEKSYGAFHQTASYVFEEHPDPYTEYDSARQCFECTKRPSIMNLWLLWAVYGRALFAQKIEYLCGLCADAYRQLNEQPDFEAVHRPQTNILCLRYRPQNLPPESLKAHFQVAIRDRVRSDGTFFISKVDIDGEAALRVVFMNHDIRPEHFACLLDEIRQAGQAILCDAPVDK